MKVFALDIPGLWRLLLVLAVILTAAAPAFEAHACTDPSCGLGPVTAETSVISSDGGSDQAPCSDCGPACANGCCHAAHVAIPVEPPVVAPVIAFATPASWRNAAPLPPTAPSGPHRPPRA